MFSHGIIASGIGFALRHADVFCAKAQRQQQNTGQLAVIAWMR
ncbi:hypothetical protein [Lysinibacillus xylanilyticus]